jgi:Flp pilus assembly protein TadG
VEFALLLPLLVFALMGGADLARAFAIQLAVQNGARAGAEAYAIKFGATPGLAQAAAVAELNRTPTVNATLANVAVSEGQADGSLCVHPPPSANPCFVTVTVTYGFQTVVVWPLVPNTATFNRSTMFRMFY